MVKSTFYENGLLAFYDARTYGIYEKVISKSQAGWTLLLLFSHLEIIKKDTYFNRILGGQ